MNINKTNSNPSFNGYVDKSVYEYFQRHQKNLLKNTKLQLEKGNPDCTKNYLDEIDLINHLIPKIKSAVTDLHPSTSIAVINKEYFIMKNDKTKTTTDLRLISEHLGAKTKSILIKDMLKKITEQKKEMDTEKSIDANINCRGCKTTQHIKMLVQNIYDFYKELNKEESND